MTSGEFGFASEKEHTMNITVTEVAPMRYGNTSSSISYDKQLASGELRPEVIEHSKELIYSGECMTEVTDSDDGCIDGRPAVEILCANNNGEFYTKPITNPTEHVRETVAGGGYVTGFAMLRGVGEQGNSIDDDFSRVGAIMDEANVHCGAHTGEHAHDKKDATDCGANDKVRDIFENAIAYRSNIAKDTQALLEAGGAQYDAATFGRVIDRWSDSLTDDEYFADSTGATRFDKIQENIRKAQLQSGETKKSVSVSKDLAGDHKEDFIVINYIEGYHFSQAVFATKLAEAFDDIPAEKRAQAFTVDVPRIVTLARAIAGSDKQRLSEALHAGVAYQLATAATLTDGSLPIFLVKES